MMLFRRSLMPAVLLAAAAFFFFRDAANGQGGPPMITDDPGTPGSGKWENNVALAFEHKPNETSFDAPALDLNYGWGEHIQLTLQSALVVLDSNGHGPVAGTGQTEAAVKWRFLDEENSGIAVSTFPRIIFNMAQSSVRRGLSDPGTRFQLPIEASKKFGPFALDAEFGVLGSTVGRSEWLYGVVGAYDVTKSTSVMAEIQGTSRVSFAREVLTLNVGVRHELSESRILIASLGHEVHSPDDEPLAFIGYLGIQFLY
jgi:hypothetical protein